MRGESIPIRLFLGAFDNLTPTFRNVNNKFSVKYFLNLVLIDEEVWNRAATTPSLPRRCETEPHSLPSSSLLPQDRRYFKQQEVTLYRR